MPISQLATLPAGHGARLRIKKSCRTAACALGLILIASSFGMAQTSPANNVKSFFQSIVGEWIGTCEQSTDGKQADNKYFHVVIEQLNPNAFQSSFAYYRLDNETGAPLNIGQSTVMTTISPDGTAKSKVVGEGTVLVNYEPKTQKHDLSEVLTSPASGTLQGEGSGTIKVSGMPFGIGNRGKIQSARSDWSLKNGVLSISQVLTVGFRAFIFKKELDVTANYVARRGSDIASLMGVRRRVSQLP